MHEQERTQWDRSVFVAGTRTLSVRDVIDAAHFRGELEPCWRRLRALVEREDQAGGLDEPDEAAVQSLSAQFRYERDLITAEETESWLAERGLTLDDFSGYFLRRHLQDRGGETIEPGPSTYLSATEELRDLLRVELWLSGEFDRMAARLSWRLAAYHVAGDAMTPESIKAERARFYERDGLDDATLLEWLAQMGRDPRWLDEMQEWEAAFRRQCAAAPTAEEFARSLHSLRVPLTRVEVESIDLESRDAAREALLCVREDGDSMADVARAGGYPHRRAEVLLEDFPVEWQQRLLCAVPGEVLEPFERGDGFQIYRLIRKIEPDGADTWIRGRVERQIVDRHFSELVARCIRWTIPPGNTL